MKQIKWLAVLLIILNVFGQPKPVLGKDEKPDIVSRSAILMDAKTGEILFSKKADMKMYPASTTKIMTGILAIESGKLNETVTVSRNAVTVEGTRVYLLEDEKMKLEQLVKGLMINSGNDAAIAIAEHLQGSVKEFANKMNKFVTEKLNLENSHFTNPHGLFNKKHYTTAYDLAKITQYAMKNETFREVVSTKKMKWDGKGWDTTLYNHNRLLWRYDGAIGVKNGYVDESQHTLVTAAKRNGTELIAVTLYADRKEQSYEDTIELLDYGFENYITEVLEKGTTYTNKTGEEFTLPKTMYYTKQVGIPTEVSVNVKRTLEVVNQKTGEVMFKYLFPNLKAKAMAKADVSKEKQTVEPTILSVGWISWVLIILTICLAVFIYTRQKLIRQKRRNQMLSEIRNNVFRSDNRF